MHPNMPNMGDKGAFADERKGGGGMIEHWSVHYDGAGAIVEVHRKPFKFVSMFDAWAKGGEERVTGEGLEWEETIVGKVKELACHA